MATLSDLLSDLPRGLDPGTPVSDMVIGRWEWLGSGLSLFESRTMQWFPESLNDTKQVEWNNKSIPGGSHPLYSFIGGGAREISFTVVLTCDEDPALVNVSVNDSKPGRSTDIRAEIQFLRQFMHAAYSKVQGARVMPPPAASLTVKNLGWGCEGSGPSGSTLSPSDTVYALMTGCDVTYSRLFPSGHPRIVEVSLTFAEIVQFDRVVRFTGRSIERWSYLARKALKVGS